jgi:hypothetical protein
MNGTNESTDAVAATSPPTSTLAEIQNALLVWLAKDASSNHEQDRLQYGRDLWPGKCERAIWYAIHGAPRDGETLGDQLRWKGGRIFESALASALKEAGLEIETQVLVRPLRPTAWAWAPGRADIVVLPWRKVIEVVAPRAGLFHRARGDMRTLARDQYRWQLSAYFHELRGRGVVDNASFVFIDREGANAPVEVELDQELLVPLDAIVAEEQRKARLISLEEPPARIGASITIEVLKGGRASKKKPTPDRVVRSTRNLSWQCSYCPFKGTCQPGPEEQPAKLADDVRTFAVAEAERRWATGEKRVVVTLDEDVAGGAS